MTDHPALEVRSLAAGYGRIPVLHGIDLTVGFDEIVGILDDPSPSFYVKALADSSVTVGLFAWVNQSENDFAKVQSFAIRRVKEALDDASITMPSPIFEVNLNEQKPGENEPLTKPATAPKREQKKVDLSPETHIDSQIDAEQAADADDNLLAP